MNRDLIVKRSLWFTFLTGASGLLYEVTWHCMLSNIIGSQAQATALVLAVFLGGLGLGYWLFGKSTALKSNSFLLKRYGIVEAAIGAWAIFSVIIYLCVWNWVGILGVTSSKFPLRELLLTIILVGPGSLMMGATLPLLTQALCDSVPRRTHALIYAVNTAGALVGCLLTGFVLLPLAGVIVVTLLGAIVNLVAGRFFIKISKEVVDTSHLRGYEISSGAIDFGQYSFQLLSVAFLAGFYALTFQSILVRLVGLSVGSSEYAFTIVVATFLAMIAFGAWAFAGRTKARALWVNQAIIALSLGVLFFTVPIWPYAFHILRTFFTTSTTSFYLFQITVVILLGLILFFPVSGMGATLPLIFEKLQAENRRGEIVGWIYGLNTLGTVLGAFIGGYLFFYVFDLEQIFNICFLLSGITLILTIKPYKKTLGFVPSAVTAGVILCSAYIFSSANWQPKRLALGIFREKKVTPHTLSGPEKFYNQYKDVRLISHSDGPNTSVAVLEFDEPEGVSRTLLVNGKPDGNTSGDARTMKLLAHLPALFSSAKSSSAAVIGYGTGLTVGSLALHPAVESIDAIDISPAVKSAAHYFDEFNANASTHPKVNWILGDAYRVLGGTEKKYGVIISQPSNPWMSGVERLYAPEFYEAVKGSLDQGGVFMQWLALYGTSLDTVRMIVEGFQRSFNEVHIFATGNDVLLLGGLAPLSTTELAEKFSTTKIKSDLISVDISTPEALLSLEQWLPAKLFKTKSNHSIHKPKLAFRAGKDFFTGKDTDLSSLVYTPEEKILSFKKSKETLLAKWIEQSDTPVDLVSVIKASCGGINVSLVEPSWRTTRSPCRDAIVAAFVSDNAQIVPNLEKDVNWAKNFIASDSYILPGQLSAPLRTAMKEIRRFSELESIFLPLSPKRLIWRASTCFKENSPEHVNCRAQLIQALSFTNHSKLARLELEKLERDKQIVLSDNQLQLLKKYVELG